MLKRMILHTLLAALLVGALAAAWQARAASVAGAATPATASHAG